MWEADDRTNANIGFLQCFFRQWDKVRLYAGCCDIVFQRKLKPIFDHLVGHRRVEKGVIYHLGKGFDRGLDFGGSRGRHCRGGAGSAGGLRYRIDSKIEFFGVADGVKVVGSPMVPVISGRRLTESALKACRVWKARSSRAAKL